MTNKTQQQQLQKQQQEQQQPPPQSEKYQIKIDAFEGPFDLLFHLIEKNKIDIYDIPISIIADQYMDYIFSMQELDMDITSEFLVMASTLLHIKSRLMLPKPVSAEDETDADPRDELVISMIEYKRFKDFSETLKTNQDFWDKSFYREPGVLDAALTAAMKTAAAAKQQEMPMDLDREKLFSIYKKLLNSYHKRLDNIDIKVHKIIEREKVPLHSKIKEIIQYLKNKSSFMFQRIFSSRDRSRTEIVTAFFALLELSKQNRISLKQDTLFGDLYIYRQNLEVMEESFPEEQLDQYFN